MAFSFVSRGWYDCIIPKGGCMLEDNKVVVLVGAVVCLSERRHYQTAACRTRRQAWSAGAGTPETIPRGGHISSTGLPDSIYIYICICMYVYVYIYADIYTYK